MFGTESLRFEKWSIAEAKPVEVRELVIRRDCWEQQFSPDGKYLACVDYDLGLSVIETETGKRVFQKKQFAKLNFFELILGRLSGLTTTMTFRIRTPYLTFSFLPTRTTSSPGVQTSIGSVSHRLNRHR